MNIIAKSYWGIDVSKNWIDISINNLVTRVVMKEKDIKNFIKKNNKQDASILAVLESTGGYEILPGRCLEANDIKVHIAHPNKVVSFAKAKGRLAKTDPIDAKL
ncbi:transposase, partial [Francisellaceae bacterium]|nr:transposase [Francisellaceae bacterium]